MKKLVIEFSNERLITPSGLSLVGQLLNILVRQSRPSGVA